MSIKVFKEEFALNFNARNPKPWFLVFSYRFSSSFAQSRFIVIKILGIPFRILYRFIIEWVMGVEIPDTTKIGHGLKIHHGNGIVVNPYAVIGDRCTLKHGVTIGCSTDLKDECVGFPKIGNNVIINPNTIVYGDIEIGDNVIIGASSVVNKSFQSNCIIAGNPARIIKTL